MTDQKSVHKVWHILTRGGRTIGHFATDMTFIDGVPTLIFEWGGSPQEEIPKKTIQLDARFLHRLEPPWPQADHMYELAVEDPRRFD
jgi:hypothetical protein